VSRYRSTMRCCGARKTAAQIERNVAVKVGDAGRRRGMCFGDDGTDLLPPFVLRPGSWAPLRGVDDAPTARWSA